MVKIRFSAERRLLCGKPEVGFFHLKCQARVSHSTAFVPYIGQNGIGNIPQTAFTGPSSSNRLKI